MTEPRHSPLGDRAPRLGAGRLAAGRGRYTDDFDLPRMLHLAYCRSAHAHARIGAIDTSAASALSGVFRIVTGPEMADLSPPWAGTHGLFPNLKAPLQHILAVERACWQGEPVAAVLAESRAQAEDAAELIEIDWEPLPPVVDPEAALAAEAPVIHAELGGNLGFETEIVAGDVDAAFRDAAVVVEERFSFGRHTGVSLEPRTIIADYDPSSDALTVHQSHQTPHQQQDLYSRLLDIPEHRVRVICPDVGGAFGLKHHLYGDEMGACVLSKLLGRPVKYVADRMESFLSDIHCRDHRIWARMALDREGEILAIEADDLFVVGAYSQYPRSSIAEANQFVRLCGAPYRHRHYRARSRMVYQNKGILGHIRSVAHPLACAVAERLVDLGAAELGSVPEEVRRRNYLEAADFPVTSPGGVVYDDLSHGACLAKLEEILDLAALRAEQAALREKDIYRGIGLASVVELTAIGPEYYGRGGQHISAQEAFLLKLEPSGTVRCATGITEQGQGSETGLAQVVASVLRLPLDAVEIASGDSREAPYGGGTYGSRGAALGGEAALRAARQLKSNVLAIAGAVLQTPPEALDLRDGDVVDADGRARMTLAEVARLGHFRPYELPDGLQPELAVVAHYASRDRLFLPANGIQGAYLEVDVETGFVTLLRHVAVHDSGTLLNPGLVEGQIKGGVVMGIGGALYEECLYDAAGQLLNASLADYRVPMAVEMPEIEVAHIVTPAKSSELGAKGAGESGTSAAMGAILNAINDAIRPLGARIAQTPATPDRILAALDAV
ncbi:MAG: xanthine dehydrogenase family protein molybdopterin-binding subunit [Alphaproteobacteria bacterium]|nr:xanthine dehydrogenase family protein molybdopterin-binding subunit [Alphaproteobacteria bacterium]